MWRFSFLAFFMMLMVQQLPAQSKYDYFFAEAEKSRLSGDNSSASELYRHCLSIRPNAPQPLFLLGVMHFLSQQDSVGLSLMEQVVRLEPSNPWYVESLAYSYIQKKDVQNAIKMMEHLVKLKPRRSDILSHLVSMYKSDGRSADALSALSRIEQLEGPTPELALDKFTLLMDMERKDEAFAELQKLCDEFPHDQNCKLLMGNQYLLLGDTLRARGIYDEVKKVEPTNINLQVSLLEYYRAFSARERYHEFRDSLIRDTASAWDLRVAMMGDYFAEVRADSTLRDSLEKEFAFVLSQPQKDARLWILRVYYLTQTGAADGQVVEALNQLLRLEPNNEGALSTLINYHVARRDNKAIENTCRQGVNYFPDKLTYHFYLGLALYDQGKKQETIDVFRQATRIKGQNVNPAEVSEMFSVLGDLYYEQGQVEQAFAAYDSSLVYKEDNLSCLNNYAYFLSLRNEQLQRAEEMSYRTVKAEPANATYLDTYAWILFMLGQYNEARIYIDRVVSPESDEKALMADQELKGNVIEHAGDIYFMTGDTQTAVWLWTIALQKADDSTTPQLEKKIRKKKYIKP